MLSAILIMSTIGFISGLFLAVASGKFHVEVDRREGELLEALPMTNCGACGFPGCSAFAKAVIKKEASVNGCVSGGARVTENLGKIMGVAAEVTAKEVAVIMCKGGKNESRDKFIYVGILDCKSAANVQGGPKSCGFGCIGYGTCEKVCPFDAITMDDNYLPDVDEKKCTGCRICAVNCPKHLIKMIPESNRIHIRCNSVEKGAITRKHCVVGCIACKKCEKTCPVNAISVKDNLAIIDPASCTNCMDCVDVCPTDTIENYIPGEKLFAGETKSVENPHTPIPPSS